MRSPSCMRNWWIEIECDGDSKTIALGPKTKEGAFSMRIYQRDRGEVKHALSVDGHCMSNTADRKEISLALVVTDGDLKRTQYAGKSRIKTIR